MTLPNHQPQRPHSPVKASSILDAWLWRVYCLAVAAVLVLVGWNASVMELRPGFLVLLVVGLLPLLRVAVSLAGYPLATSVLGGNSPKGPEPKTAERGVILTSAGDCGGLGLLAWCLTRVDWQLYRRGLSVGTPGHEPAYLDFDQIESVEFRSRAVVVHHTAPALRSPIRIKNRALQQGLELQLIKAGRVEVLPTSPAIERLEFGESFEGPLSALR